jgi:hypothetical protein
VNDIPSSENSQPDGQHRSSRTNLLLSGTIEARDIRSSVRIRNLSETGALLEGAALPKVGEHLVLRRLDLEIGATVIWSASSRCGVTFSGTISVDHWRAGSWVAPRLSEKQEEVDRIQSAVRAGKGENLHGILPDLAVQTTIFTDKRIADELLAVQQLLEKMGDQLSDDAGVVQRHSLTLQSFDQACQSLGRLIDILASGTRT